MGDAVGDAATLAAIEEVMNEMRKTVRNDREEVAAEVSGLRRQQEQLAATVAGLDQQLRQTGSKVTVMLTEFKSVLDRVLAEATPSARSAAAAAAAERVRSLDALMQPVMKPMMRRLHHPPARLPWIHAGRNGTTHRGS